MVEIKERSREFTPVEEYLMTIAPNMVQMNSVEDGEKITIEAYLVFNDTKEDGTTTEVLSMITPEKKVYSCQSITFKKSVFDIWNLFKGIPVTIVKSSGKTKAGRNYINCYLDTESM